MSKDQQLDRILTRLRDLIREQGFTQEQVQEQLGWGRSYLRQLWEKKKSLRVEQVVMILGAIGADGGAFWGGIYDLSEARPGVIASSEPGDVEAEVQRLGVLYEGLVNALRKQGLVSTEALATAIKKAGALDQI